eukprot:3200216-Alexandrium_andersonii.AAC.1
MTRNTFGRNSGNPAGDLTKPHTRLRNTIAEFVARAIMCASALGLRCVLEQPMASLLARYPQAGRACCCTARV